ncbi:MAG: hypothetical protein HYS13_09405 [Planctomycetia bacterium]|nr:hypothetical protein [Planctomycetia bacterium]
MLTWVQYRAHLSRVTLRQHGAGPEIRGCESHHLDVRFPQYEEFWRHHIVPCTNRPTNIYFRDGLSPVMERIACVNFGIWNDLVHACDLIARVKQGEFGYDYRNCIDAMKCGGDAIQKFADLQEIVTGRKNDGNPSRRTSLAGCLATGITVFTRQDKLVSEAWRKTNSAYRHQLTHDSPLAVFIDGSTGTKKHLILKPEHVAHKNAVSWRDLASQYRSNQARWDRIETVCDELNANTVDWLNTVYGKLNAAMHRLWRGASYIALFGVPPTRLPVDTTTISRRSFPSESITGVTCVQEARLITTD